MSGTRHSSVGTTVCCVGRTSCTCSTSPTVGSCRFCRLPSFSSRLVFGCCLPRLSVRPKPGWFRSSFGREGLGPYLNGGVSRAFRSTYCCPCCDVRQRPALMKRLTWKGCSCSGAVTVGHEASARSKIKNETRPVKTRQSAIAVRLFRPRLLLDNVGQPLVMVRKDEG